MKTKLFYFLIFAISLLSLSACRNETVVMGDASQLADGSAGTITCSERCELKSQCGKVEETRVIMGGIEAPVVENWDMMMVNGTAVTINTSRPRTVQKIIDQTEETLFFYNVTMTDGSNTTGWIAGWCVSGVVLAE